MSSVTSADGTTITFDQTGAGPALIIVLGGPTDRSVNAPLADLLARHFTVFNYDRRGHGSSGDTRPYAVDREYDDLQAILAAAGGSAFLFGTSSGAVIALEAAARGLDVRKLALWEPPFVLADETTRPRPPSDYASQLSKAVSAGRPGDALELFFTKAVDMPSETVAPMRQAPFWSTMEGIAQTLVYDAQIMGDFTPPLERIAAVRLPVLVIDGGMSPWLTNSAIAVAATLPDAHRRSLARQPHNVAPAALAPILDEYFSD